MAMAADISAKRGRLLEDENSRIKALLQRVNLPSMIPCDSDSLLDAIRKDKKRQDKDIHFVLLSGIGKAEIAQISYQRLEDYTHDLCKHC
jgi:3-dehydroquinate synthetase